MCVGASAPLFVSGMHGFTLCVLYEQSDMTI